MRKSLIIVATIFFGILSIGYTSTLFTGSFSNMNSVGYSTTAPIGQAYNGTPIDGVTVSKINPSTGPIYSSTSSGTLTSYNGVMFSSWGTGATTASNVFTGAIDLNKYITFSLTAAPGSQLDMTLLEFGIRRTPSGARQFQLRTSADNYASAFNNYTTLGQRSGSTALTNSGGTMTMDDHTSTGSYLGFRADLTSLAPSDSIDFRLYFFNAEADAGVAGLSTTLTFSGALVPEPSTGSMVLLGMGGLAAVRLLRRKVS